MMILSNQCQESLDGIVRNVENNRRPFLENPRRECNRLLSFMPIITDGNVPNYVKVINKVAIDEIESGQAVPYFAAKYNVLPDEPARLQLNYIAKRKEALAKQAPVLYYDGKTTSARTMELYKKQNLGKLTMAEYLSLINRSVENSGFIKRGLEVVRKCVRTALSKVVPL